MKIFVPIIKAWFVLVLILFFLAIFQSLTSSRAPTIVIVPHHNLVKEKRIIFLNQFSKQNFKHIIILSPDHFSPKQNSVSYADKNWNTGDGKISFDNDPGIKITKNLAKQNGLVSVDHGITNILPDIAKIWPKAKVVPIIIGQQVKFSKLKDLVAGIKNNCQKECLLIASVDFSHYLPRALADIHDQKSIRILTGLEDFSENSIEVDSPQSLYVVTQIAIANNLKSWNLFAHTNSGSIENNRDIETTSHIFGWWSGKITNKTSMQTKTFLLAKNIDSEKDKAVLGNRFFYGVDYQDLKLSSTYNLNEKISIEPTGNPSSTKIVNGKLKIMLGTDVAVGGYANKDNTVLIFLPMVEKDGQYSLTRGSEKTAILNKLLSGISNENFKLDILEGKVVILSK